MHEASIAEAMLKQLGELCEAHHRDRLRSVVVEVGDRAGVNREALRFALDALTPGSCAADAQFDWVGVASELRCQACGYEGPPEGPFCVCPACASLDVTIRGGQALMIQRVEFV